MHRKRRRVHLEDLQYNPRFQLELDERETVSQKERIVVSSKKDVVSEKPTQRYKYVLAAEKDEREMD